MSDIYKIGISLTMASNAPAFFTALSRQILHTHTHVKDLEGGLTRLSKIKLAIGGGLAVAGGAASLSLLGKMVDKGNELVKVQQNMAAVGVKAAEVQEAYAKSWEMTRKYQNVGAAEIMNVINEARMTFGSQHEATAHVEDFIKMISFLKAFQGGKHGAGAGSFIAEANAAMKSGELAGKISPADMAEHVKQLTAMRAAYGEQLKIGQYLTAQRAGGVALRNTSDEFRYGMFPALVQENGPGAGVMLMTAFNKIVAGTGNKTKSLQHMADIGLLDPSHINYDKTGRAIGLKDPAGIANNQAAAINFGDWVMKTLKPKLDAQTTDPIRQAQLISAMFPDRNAAKAITEILQQFTKLSKDAALMAQARKSINEGAYLDKSWEGQKQAFHEQWENFVQALGAPLVAQATENLKMLNGVLSDMSQYAAKPENAATIQAIGKGIAILGASLVGAGATALIAALGPAGWLVLGIGALAAGAEAIKPGYLATLAADWTAWVKAIGSGDIKGALTGALKGINDMLLGLPLEMAKVAKDIGSALVREMAPLADLLGAEIKTWPGRLAETIAGMGTAIVDAIKGALGNLFSLFSRTSFEGGGAFGGASIHKASLGGGANDNGGPAIPGLGGGSGSSSGSGAGSGLGSGADYHAFIGGKHYRSAYVGGGRARVGSWLDFYQRPVSEGGLGMPLDKARAMVAMTQGESGINLNPGAIGSAGEIGTAQWLGSRARALMGLAARMGKHWTDPGVQQQHMRNEMLGAYRGVYDRIMRAPSGEAALAEGINNFERPKYRQKAYNFRLPYLHGLRRSGAVGTGADTPPPAVSAPPHQKNETHIHNVYMDGERVHRHVERRMVAKAKFPTSVGGMDGHGQWMPPGTTLTDVA